ncbi:MAG: hypothetical protein II543_04400, partial [Desulfovibrio sp.]|nr:hypothetical protein [Desulfovibrio sp.]
MVDNALIFLQMHATCKMIMSLRFSGFCGQKSASGAGAPHEKQPILDRPTARDASGVQYIMRHFLSTVVLLAMALSLAGCELPFGKKGGQP